MAKYAGIHSHPHRDHPALYIIANRSSAVFYGEDRRHPFHFLLRLSNPKGRRTEGELVSDRPGRSNSVGSIRHALEPRVTKHEANAKKFASKVAKEVEHLRSRMPIESIIIAAEPHFMGILRSELTSEVQRLVTHEIKREYIQGSDLATLAKLKKAMKTKESASGNHARPWSRF